MSEQRRGTRTPPIVWLVFLGIASSGVGRVLAADAVKELRAFGVRKPIILTEVGYRSITGTAIRPGSWTISGTSDPDAQADAYKAFFQVWTANGGNWLKGVQSRRSAS